MFFLAVVLIVMRAVLPRYLLYHVFSLEIRLCCHCAMNIDKEYQENNADGWKLRAIDLERSGGDVCSHQGGPDHLSPALRLLAVSPYRALYGSL